MIEQAKSTYSPLVKGLEKQTKIIEDQESKQTDAIINQNKRQMRKGVHESILIDNPVPFNAP